VNLVFIGDSLTQWFDWASRFPGDRVLNLGISGEMVEELLARMDRIQSQPSDPDHVFLMSGINDILMERYEISSPYREIVRSFTQWWKGSRIIVQSLLPVDMPWISNDLIRDVNRQLSKIAWEYEADYLDVFALFLDSAGNPQRGLLSEDGVHLTKRGYAVWSQSVEEYLRQAARSRQQEQRD
jgi:lysophospholipase L1-like esterase